MEKLEALEKSYKTGLHELMLAEKVREAVLSKITQTGQEIAQIWMNRECIEVGTVLVNLKNYHGGTWIVEEFRLGQPYKKGAMPTLDNVMLVCRKRLKGGRLSKNKPVLFYRWDWKEMKILEEKGGDESGQEERG